MYAAYEKTIAVGASINANPTNPVNSSQADHNGNTNNLPAVVDTRTYYSPFGPSLDIVAPSHTCYDGGLVDPILSAVREDTGDIPGDDTVFSPLQSAAAVGDNSVTVNSAAGFAVGEYLIIGTPLAPNREYFRINAIAGNTITLNGTLANAQAAGTVVSSGPNDYSFDFGGTSHACPTVAGAAAPCFIGAPQFELGAGERDPSNVCGSDRYHSGKCHRPMGGSGRGYSSRL